MDLETFWFFLIAVLWAGYFLLEGFDFGVGMLLPFVPRSDEERGTLAEDDRAGVGRERGLARRRRGSDLRCLPAWYATMFSGLLPRAPARPRLPDRPRRLVRVALEERERRAGARRGPGRTRSAASARRSSGGSALANLVNGVPIDSDGDFAGDLRRSLQPVHACGGHRGRRSCSRSTARRSSRCGRRESS